MFNKPYLVKIFNQDGQELNISLKLSNSQLETLISHDIDCHNISLSYTLPKDKPKTNFQLYLNLFFQDLSRGSIINSLRYPIYLLLRKQYGDTLNDKELAIVKEYEEKSKEEGCTNSINLPSLKPSKIILLSSSGKGIGKSTIAQKLVNDSDEKLDTAIRLSFADSIRYSISDTISNITFEQKDIFDPEYYNKNKNDIQNHLQDFDSFCIRDFLCDFSDVIQKHLGKECWATAVINFIEETQNNVYVIDDLRRDIEKEAIINKFGKENVITVFLDKENKDNDNTNNISEIASKYEGQIDPNECDISFTFNSNWSNSDQLLTLIKEKL